MRHRPSRSSARHPATLPHRSAALALAAVAAVAADASAQQRLAQLGPQLPDAAADTFALAVGDVDRDGDPDMVCSRQNQVCLHLNDGRGVFTDATPTHMPANGRWCNDIALADVDGDGDLDLLQMGYGQDRLYVNDGTGRFTDETARQVPDNAWSLSRGLAVGDIDDDGDLDVLIGQIGYGYGMPNELWINDGQGSFTKDTSGRFPRDADDVRSLAFADVDGDGDLDAVSGNHGRNTLYLNDGTGTFTDDSAARWPNPGVRTLDVVVADFDSDGDLDIVCANAFQDRAYRNDGVGFFTEVTASTMPADHQFGSRACTADIDGDGDLDLIFASGGGQQLRMALNDGTGRFSDVPESQLPADSALTMDALLEDLDADGDPDLVLAHAWSTNQPSDDRIYRNLQRQLHAPAPPRVGQPYQLDVYARHGQPNLFEVALPCVALAPASVRLPPIGTLGLDPNGLIPLQPVLISPLNGMASATIPIPNRPSLAGTDLFGQALMIRYPGLERLTNVTRGTLR